MVIEMSKIYNPILRGFNPDPSILCVGEDYYIATSTFEWFPGIQIYHSKDLVEWKLITRPLQTRQQVDLSGDMCSGGIWAPCLSYNNGKFYLIYTNVRNFGATFYDVENFLITASDIMGPWSEPVFLNASGFDPSLFHDSNGKKWLLNMCADFRTWNVRFAGIVLQEYSEAEQKLIGEPKIIYRGTSARTVEGPHLYKKDGYYYLLCAEGGTGFRHQEIVLRSKTIDHSYELSPYHCLITTYPYPQNLLQKSGHASITEGCDGNWYLAHLCSRPIGPERTCILGRETSIQKLKWEDGWPYLYDATNEPQEVIEIEDGKQDTNVRKNNWIDHFDQEEWNIEFQSLRVPLGDRASLTEKKSYLRLSGKESLESCFKQSLLAVRQKDFRIRVTTKLSFEPERYQQMAGLTYYYDKLSHYYVYITYDEDKKKVLSIMHMKLGKFSQPIGVGIQIPDNIDIYLRLETDYDKAQFYYSIDGIEYQKIGDTMDATILSDDYYELHGHGNRFTGAFVGICCQDLSGTGKEAYFDYFQYEEI